MQLTDLSTLQWYSSEDVKTTYTVRVRQSIRLDRFDSIDFVKTRS